MLFIIAALSFIVVLSVVIIGYAAGLVGAERVQLLHSLSWMQLIIGGALFYYCQKNCANVFFSGGASHSIRYMLVRSAILLSVLLLVIGLIFGLTERTSNWSQLNLTIALKGLFYYLVLIALAEEVLFRGLPFFSNNHRPGLIILISSVLFALYHFNNGLHTLPYYFSLGVLLAVLRYFSVSLLALAVGHGLFDFMVILVWPGTGFRFGVAVFYVVSPIVILGIAALAGWMLKQLDT